MAADTIILWAELTIERGRHSLLSTESLCCDFGTIKFAKSLIAFCKPSGWLLRDVAVRIPHLNPLPFGKAEANALKMKTDQPLFLNEEQVREHLRMTELIPAMEKALIDFSAGRVTQPVRSIISIDPPGGFLGLMPALTPDGLGLKAVTFYPSNAERGIPTHMATIFLVDPQTGTPLAIMDGRLITEMRTAAVSAAATKLLASPDAKVLAILGSGVQARSHVEALRLVRQIEEIRVWSPTLEHANRFAQEIHGTAASSAEEAVRGADVIVTVTSSKTPILKGEWLKPGCHVNAIGACRPDWRELDDEAIQKNVVFVDSREGALKESGDVILSGAKIHAELGEALAAKVPARANATTIFKSLGMAVEDIAAAMLVYRSCLGSRAAN